MSHDMHACACFMCMFRVSITSAASPAPTHPSIKEAALRAASTKGGGRLRRPPPFVDSFMDGCGEAGEAQGILKGSFHENFSATSWESCATSSQLRSNFVTNNSPIS